MRKLGIAETLIASVLFGFLGYFGKLWIKFTGEPTQVLIAYRFCLASLLYGLLILVFRRKLFVISKNQLLISMALGVFGYSLFATLYFKAIEGLSIAFASLLLNTHPLLVSLLSALFLKSKLTKFHWLACLLGMLGLICFVSGEIELKSYWAVAAGLGSALSYSIYLLVSGRFQGQGIHPITSSFYVILTAAITLSLLAGRSPLEMSNLNHQALLVVLGIALFSTIFPLTLILAGLQKIKSYEAALLSMAEPLTAALISWLLLSEEWNFRKFIGTTLVIGSIAIPILVEHRNKPNSSASVH